MAAPSIFHTHPVHALIPKTLLWPLPLQTAEDHQISVSRPTRKCRPHC